MLNAKRALQLALAVVIATAAAALATTTSHASGQASHATEPSSVKIDNPYFPLVPGTTNIYTGIKDGQKAMEFFEVTGKTKKILGVTTRVVRDRLYLGGFLFEDTVDWFAQDKAGTVWYYGEATRTLDHSGHVVSTEGSFLAGVNGARQGIFMPARLVIGTEYQQEFAKGHAEDHFKIINLSAKVTVPAGTFKNTLLTHEWTPLEPTVLSEKNFAKGIGTVNEHDTKGSDEHLELLTVLHG
jgi:hypothetical protein